MVRQHTRGFYYFDITNGINAHLRNLLSFDMKYSGEPEPEIEFWLALVKRCVKHSPFDRAHKDAGLMPANWNG